MSTATLGETTVVIISGARWHPDPVVATSALAKYVLTEAPGWVIVRHGACPGFQSVDQAVHEWVRDCGEALGVLEDPMPADWDNCVATCPAGHRIRKRYGDIEHPGKLDDYCPHAGPRRNRAMVTKDGPSPRRLIAAPYRASRGTRNAVRLAREVGIPIQIVVPPKPAPERLF
jgi:hypothetical protein